MSAATELQFEEVARGFYLEGLLVTGDDIWFTDVVSGGVRKVGSDQVLLPERGMIGGLALNDDGAILISGAGGIAWAHPKTGRSGTLIGGFGGVNEMCADDRGGMFFGTTDLSAILRGDRPGPSTIKHLATDLTVTRRWDGLTFANGLVVNPDGTTLYFNESFSATRAFPIGEDGALSAPRTLIDMPDCDGMTLDAEGNIWVTGFASSELRCVSPNGEEVRRIALPGQASTNVRFGGNDLRDLYITIVDPAAAQALAPGTPIEEQNSVLYRTRSPVAGRPAATTRFKL